MGKFTFRGYTKHIGSWFNIELHVKWVKKVPIILKSSLISEKHEQKYAERLLIVCMSKEKCSQARVRVVYSVYFIYRFILTG